MYGKDFDLICSRCGRRLPYCLEQGETWEGVFGVQEVECFCGGLGFVGSEFKLAEGAVPQPAPPAIETKEEPMSSLDNLSGLRIIKVRAGAFLKTANNLQDWVRLPQESTAYVISECELELVVQFAPHAPQLAVKIEDVLPHPANN